jgi:hypothetical protein
LEASEIIACSQGFWSLSQSHHAKSHAKAKTKADVSLEITAEESRVDISVK